MVEKKNWLQIIGIFSVGFLYFSLGKLSFALSVSNGIVTNVPFFAEGIGLAAVILFGNIYALGIFLGQLVLALSSGVGLEGSLLISTINAFLAIFGKHLFQRAKLTTNLSQVRDVIYLSAIILFIIQPISAILGNFTLWYFHKLDAKIFYDSVIAWWLGNAIGQLTLVPFIFLLFTKRYVSKTFFYRDLPIAVVTLILTFITFRITNYINQSYAFVILLLLLPVTLFLSSQNKPETVVFALLFMTIAAFFAISLNLQKITGVKQIENFAQLDLLIISLQLSGLILTVLIFDLKRTQSLLSSSKQRLSAILDTTFAGFSIINYLGVHLFTNQNSKTIHGYEQAEIIGAHFQKIVHPSDLDLGEKILNDIILEKEKYITAELRLLHKQTQQPIWLHLIATKYPKFEKFDDESVLVFFQDITKQKEIEQKLLEAQEIGNFGHWSYQLENKQMQWSAQVFRIYEQTPENFIPTSSNVIELLHPDDREKVDNAFRKSVESHTNLNIEHRILTPSGKVKYIVQRANIKCSGDSAFLVLGTVVDVTERKKNELKIEEQNKKLKELNATKDKFVSIIAHDLKNPFNSLLGFSELLMSDLNENNNERTQEFASIINSTAQNTYTLLENLLEWAATQQNKINFQPKLLALNALTDECLVMVSGSAKRKQIEVENLITNDFAVFADAQMLKTVIRNLLTNAIKFSNENTQVQISARYDGKNAEVIVTDHGIGMNQKTKESLFKIGETRSMQGTASETGTGLGLILCKEFIEKNAGTIWVESEEGKGSQFKFTIPMA